MIDCPAVLKSGVKEIQLKRMIRFAADLSRSERFTT